MEKIKIPNLNTLASRIGLGTWVMGGSLWGGSIENDSIKAIHQALDLGVNLIDTAPAYGKGISEKIVGKALKQYGRRDQLIIATKAGLSQKGEGVFRDSRRESLNRELESSLKLLQVDYIDLYQIHWPDPTTPIQEAAETLNNFLKQGKIRAIGVSNYSIDQIEEFKKYASLHTEQSDFNIFEREIEKDILPYCSKSGIAVLGYSSLCRGLLSGKMTKDYKFKDDDLRKGMDPKFKEPHFSQYIACVEALKVFAKDKYEKSIIDLAVRWSLDKGIGVALWGARHPDQLKGLQGVFGWKLTQADFAEIDKIIAKHVTNPASHEFMAPPIRETSNT